MKTPMATFVLAAAAAAAFSLSALAQEPAPTPAAAPAAAASAPAPAVNIPPKTYFEAFEVTISGKAKAAGAVVLVFQTIGGEPKAATVNVLAKTGENDIARDAAKELTVAAGSAFKVKTKSGNVIVIQKASKNAPNLNISLGMQTVPGVAVSFGEY
ncbi:MAG TPA: hypothetical protein PLB01_07710 [Thermoanaerobaculia bacterium]|nr:hypothetical protein [Thermoanaerobaculia bacterium]